MDFFLIFFTFIFSVIQFFNFLTKTDLVIKAPHHLLDILDFLVKQGLCNRD